LKAPEEQPEELEIVPGATVAPLYAPLQVPSTTAWQVAPLSGEAFQRPCLQTKTAEPRGLPERFTNVALWPSPTPAGLCALQVAPETVQFIVTPPGHAW